MGPREWQGYFDIYFLARLGKLPERDATPKSQPRASATEGQRLRLRLDVATSSEVARPPSSSQKTGHLMNPPIDPNVILISHSSEAIYHGAGS